jgi:hypothetical protein
MKPEAGAAELSTLVEEAGQDDVRRSGPANERWKAKAEVVMGAALGANSATLTKFRNLRYSVGIWTGAPGEDARDARFFAGRVLEAAALIEAAIHEIELMGAEEGLEGVNYDVGLWQHVRHSVEEERWEQVASQCAIYVEDKVRRWAGRSVDGKGQTLVGQGLFAHAFAEDGPLGLGSQASERQGWRSLGVGLVGALGNVDRHHVQERPDARQYAIGVLGLASLLLTQMKREHPDLTSSSP